VRWHRKPPAQVVADPIAAARAEGFALAVAYLRDDERLGAWFEARLAAAESRPWPPNEYPPSREYADYLESAREGDDG